MHREISLDVPEDDQINVFAVGISTLTAIGLVVALAAGFLLLSHPDTPPGAIGYRINDVETWVRPDGAAARFDHSLHDEHIGLGAVTGAVPWEFPSPDARHLAYLDPGDNARLHVWNGSSSHLIGRISEIGDPELVYGPKEQAAVVGGVPVIVSWSPDSSAIAWGSISGSPEVLNVTAADVSWARAFALDEGWVGEAVWSPDGRFLAISSYGDGQHTLYVLDTRDWSFGRVLDGCHIAWSPDSKWIALHRDPGTESGVWYVNPGDPSDRTEITPAKNAFPLGWFAD